jgi:DNA-binding NtrC family response regulator
VVQGIVNAHGGSIDVASAPGQGTSFEILFPRVVEDQPGSARQEADSPASDPAVEGTLLLVEDEEALRISVAKMLGMQGFTVFEAGDGSTAIEMLRAHCGEIDLLLLDITIPGSSSQDVVVEAVRLQPEIKIVLTSAYSERMASSFDAPQIRGFVRKPFRVEELVRSLKSA